MPHRFIVRFKSLIFPAAAEPVMLVGVVIFVLMVWSFLAIAGEVGEGDTYNIDKLILLLMRDPLNISNPLGPPWLQETMRDVSGLGSIAILTLVTIGAALYLFILKQAGRSFYLLLTTSSGIALSVVLKVFFNRPRPDLVPHGSIVFTASFPSGHSMMSAIVYLTIGALLAQAHSNRGLKLYFMGLAIFLTLIVGISRVYLGVHWPSDVLAGWVVGAACALFFWLGQAILQVSKKDPAQ